MLVNSLSGTLVSAIDASPDKSKPATIKATKTASLFIIFVPNYTPDNLICNENSSLKVPALTFQPYLPVYHLFINSKPHQAQTHLTTAQLKTTSP
jgi:hypothetical protein